MADVLGKSGRGESGPSPFSATSEIAVGRLIRARGNRGELIAEIYSSHPNRAEELKNVTLDLEGRRVSAAVEQVWYHGGTPVLKFAGIDSIDDAEDWAGADILVPESERVQAEAGEFFYSDLIGCTVVADRTIGVVAGIEDYGSAPLLKVHAEDGREILVPFALSICREVDVAAKVIRVDLPDGLLDLP
jgi:16S rRNA processing protein RimM